MKTTTIYAVATDGSNGTECHMFSNEKDRDKFLVKFRFDEDTREEAMRLTMEHGFFSEEMEELLDDDSTMNSELDSYATDEIEVPMRFRLTHPTLTIQDEPRILAEMLRQGNTVLAANGHPASHATIEELLAALVAIGKAEILLDFKLGNQCWDAPDFSALHDNTDANEYALLCDDQWAWVYHSETPEHEEENEWRVQSRIDVGNAVQEALNEWLIDTLPLRKVVAESIFVHHPSVLDSVGEWTSHRLHPRTEWQLEVAAGDTQLGYWEWVSNRLRD